jgi:SAM-dependent methyltransferase
MVEEYNGQFFEMLREGARRSAEVIVPLVIDLIRPRSVIDVGCGTGAWLATFARHGVADYLGVDAFAPLECLDIPRERFVQADLTRPLGLGRRFDLAVSLEVAEHLPQASATCFIESLTRLAPVVLFSAAIPGQGGTNHLNEQWPEYWSRLLAAEGFDPYDVVRPRVWHDERVEVWYAQNTILYVAHGSRAALPRLRRAMATAWEPLAAVHPRLLAEWRRRAGEAERADTEAAARAERLENALAAAREKIRALCDMVEPSHESSRNTHQVIMPSDKDERPRGCE